MKNQKTYFFLRGFMRSGTNWIGNLLNLHPEICCNGEYHFHRLYEGFERITNPKREPQALLMHPDLRLKATVEFERFVKRLIELGSRPLNKPVAFVLGGRTPSPLRKRVIRNAKRIHVIRDGRDCLVSSTFHFLRLEKTSYPFEGFPEMLQKKKLFQSNSSLFLDQPELLLDNEDWVRSRAKKWNKRIQQDKLFIDRNKDLIFCLSYEKLHANTDSTRSQMYAFLGVDPAKAAPLDNQTTAGFKKENIKSHYRKGAIGDWKKYFNEDVNRWFFAEADAGMKVAKYKLD